MVFKRRSESPTCLQTSAIVGEALPPLLEGPCTPEKNTRRGGFSPGRRNRGSGNGGNGGVKGWVMEQLEKTHLNHLGFGFGIGVGQCSKRNRARQLLATLGTSLGPFPVGKLPPTVCPKDSPIETSSAQYIVQQYIAATGGSKLHAAIRNAYATGRTKLVMAEFESAATNCSTMGIQITSSSSSSNNNSNSNSNSISPMTMMMNTTSSSTGSGMIMNSSSNSSSSGSSNSSSIIRPREISENGCFVIWQMAPEKWYVELALGGMIKARAGCDGKIVWKQSPFSGSQGVRGPIRPLRRALNGLDPRTVATMFLTARCVGEKRVAGGEDCFVLKLASDSYTAGGAAWCRAVYGEAGGDVGVEEEVIRHVAFGYFSQRSGLLVRMEDSQLTRVATPSGHVSYWEITVEATLGDYRAVDASHDGAALMVPHGGSSVVSIFRFGEESMCHTRTRVEESWSIDDAAFNVEGLSAECFIPPADMKLAPTASDAGEIYAQNHEEQVKNQQQHNGLQSSLWGS